MAGFTYSIRFDAVRTGGVSKTLEVLERIDRRIDTLNNNVNRFGNNLANAGKRGQQSFGGLSTSVGGLVTQLGAAAAILNSIKTAAQNEGLEQSIGVAVGGAEKGAKALKFLRDTSEYLGINYVSAAKGYKMFAASLQGSNIAKDANDIFYSVAVASRVGRLGAEKTEGVFLALSQIMNKGKLTAEELTGQLAERLPKAYQLAAESMGMTSARLADEMKKGTISAEQFLPKFAKTLYNTYAKDLPMAIVSAEANFERFNNKLYDLRVAFGQELLPVALKFMREFLIPGVFWLKQNASTLAGVAIGLSSVWVGLKAYSVVLPIASLLTGGLTASVRALTVAFLANPVGIVIAGMAALASAFTVAWNTSENFRGGVEGTLRSLGEFGNIIRDFVLGQAKALGVVLQGIFTFNPAKIAEGIALGLSSSTSVVLSAGERMGKAYDKGWNRGVGKFREQKAFDFAPSDALSSAFKNVPGGGGNGGPGGGSDKIKQGVDSITGGGSQTKTINISVNKLVESLNIHSQTVDKGISQMRELVQKELLELLNSANQVQ